MATIADMQAYNMLQRIGPMNEGLALGGEEEGGGSPYQPYKPAPSGPYSPPPPRKKDKELANTRGYQVTGLGFFADPAGRVFQNIDGKLIYEGNYDEGIHGELIPPTEQANQSMQINPLMAQFPYEFDGGVVTPRYFTPPRYRNQPFLHMRTKDIKDEELFHFNNFIRSMGGGLDTVRRQTPLSIG